jgi:membrane protease YdiL (CAAX protease family)
MRKFSNPWIGILAASLVFGLIHVNPIQVFYATMLGIVFGWIYYRTGNLMPVVIGHVLNNSLAAMMMYFGLDAEEKALSASSEITLLIVSSVAAVVTAWLINRIQQDIIPWYDATDKQQATE